MAAYIHCAFLLLVVLVCANEALPPIITLGWQGAARTPITIMKLALSISASLNPCPVGNEPREQHYDDWEQCADRCPGHCGGVWNCNATCVMEGRCICGAWQNCLYDLNNVDPETGLLHRDCYDLNALPASP